MSRRRGVSKRRGREVLLAVRGSEGRHGTAQVAARIDRPGCALQCRRRDQPTHLLAEHLDSAAFRLKTQMHIIDYRNYTVFSLRRERAESE